VRSGVMTQRSAATRLKVEPAIRWPHKESRNIMILLGVVLILIGIFAAIPILYPIGLILLIIGVVLAVLGSLGRAVGPRRHYW